MSDKKIKTWGQFDEEIFEAIQSTFREQNKIELDGADKNTGSENFEQWQKHMDNMDVINRFYDSLTKKYLEIKKESSIELLLSKPSIREGVEL